MLYVLILPPKFFYVHAVSYPIPVSYKALLRVNRFPFKLQQVKESFCLVVSYYTIDRRLCLGVNTPQTTSSATPYPHPETRLESLALT